MNSGVSGHSGFARARQRHLDDGLDAARPRGHHVDAVGQENRFLDVVGDEQHRDAELLPDIGQDLLHHHAGLGIERAERLVHQQHLRARRQRADDADALLHAARKLVGIMVLEREQPGEIEQRARGAAALYLSTPAIFRPNSTFLRTDSHGNTRILLEHHAAVGAGPGDRLAVQRRIAVRRFIKPATMLSRVDLPQPEGRSARRIRGAER